MIKSELMQNYRANKRDPFAHRCVTFANKREIFALCI